MPTDAVDWKFSAINREWWADSGIMALGKVVIGTTVRSLRTPFLRKTTRRGSGDSIRGTLSVVVQVPSRLAHIRSPLYDINWGAFTKWKHVWVFKSRKTALELFLNVWRYHRHELSSSGINIEVISKSSAEYFHDNFPFESLLQSWWISFPLQLHHFISLLI